MNGIKRILVGILIIVVGYGLYKISQLYSPGSYPNVETYGFAVSEDELLTAINKFKSDHPIYALPQKFELKEGRRDTADHWYSIYFYYPLSKELIYVWIRPKGLAGYCTLGFVSINRGDQLGNWKDINKDFSSAENIMQKKKFENAIVNPIRKIIADTASQSER